MLFRSDDNYRENKILDLAKNIKNLSCDDINYVWFDLYSRRKAVFHINSSNEIGFFAAKSKDIVKIKQCLICDKNVFNLKNELELFLQSFSKNLLQNAIITNFDNGLDLSLIAKKDLTFKQNQKLIKFAQEQNINISYSFYNNEFLPIFIARKNKINLTEYNLDLDSSIFIQANRDFLQLIINLIKKEIQDINQAKIADIYCGFGVYSFAIIDLVKNIVAYEGSNNMIKMLQKNIKNHNLGSKIFAKMQDLMQNPISNKELNKFDLVIINPPRNGATPQIKEIAKSNLKKIIYISCNPKTFDFDSSVLIGSNFKIKKLTVFDQFIGSKHLEIVGIFDRYDY